MNILKSRHSAAWAGLLLAWLLGTTACARAGEQTFEQLQVGTQLYTNVTVLTKAESYIFITHAGGMGNIKLADLSQELREKLGYVSTKAAVHTNSPAQWAQQNLAKIQSPQVKQLESQLSQAWVERGAVQERLRSLLNPKLLVAVGLGLMLLNLFHCYCCKLICDKAGHPPGALIWVPLLQAVPLLRAAGMSGWWLLALFVPLLQLVPSVMWCFKIAQARGKSFWVGLFLLLPVSNLLAFLYLAFSDGASPPTKGASKAGVEIMSLEAT